MWTNGGHAIFQKRYHHTDIVRAKAPCRLEGSVKGEDPFFLFVSPTAPRVDDQNQTTIPCKRHMDLFPNTTAPRLPSFNPPDNVHSNTLDRGCIKDIPYVDESNITRSKLEHRRRAAQSLKGIDEMLADILRKLYYLDNTYSILFLIQITLNVSVTRRMTAGKAAAYIEDTDISLVGRGQGIPLLPSSLIDMAPAFLDTAIKTRRH